MKFIILIFGIFFIVFSAQAEIIETDDDAVAIFGTELNFAEMNTIVGYIYDMLYGDGGGYPSFASAAAIVLFTIVLTITAIKDICLIFVFFIEATKVRKTNE